MQFSTAFNECPASGRQRSLVLGHYPYGWSWHPCKAIGRILHTMVLTYYTLRRQLTRENQNGKYLNEPINAFLSGSTSNSWTEVAWIMFTSRYFRKVPTLPFLSMKYIHLEEIVRINNQQNTSSLPIRIYQLRKKEMTKERKKERKEERTIERKKILIAYQCILITYNAHFRQVFVVTLFVNRLTTSQYTLSSPKKVNRARRVCVYVCVIEYVRVCACVRVWENMI